MNRKYKEGFLDTNYEKTIYLVWRNKQYGLGDKIRGAIFLHQYCKNNKINLKIDATDDVCSEYLKNVVSNNYRLVKDKSLIILRHSMNNDEVETLLKENLSTNDTIFVFSNFYPNENLDEDDKEFGKFISQPTNSLKSKIDEKIRDLPTNYGIKHFRFEDKVFNNDVDSNDPRFKKYFKLLQQNYRDSDVLISNSNNFKKYAKEKLNIKTIDCNNELCKIEHTGETMENNESVKNTFIEFFIVANSSYIKTYTYGWASNFVKWPAKIYDIPFEHIYVE